MPALVLDHDDAKSLGLKGVGAPLEALPSSAVPPRRRSLPVPVRVREFRPVDEPASSGPAGDPRSAPPQSLRRRPPPPLLKCLPRPVEHLEVEAEDFIAGPSSTERPRSRRVPWWEEVFSEDWAGSERSVTPGEVAREVDFIESSLGIEPSAKVLDLGCGAGHHAVELARRGYRVVGYDLSLHQLDLARKHAQEYGHEVGLVHGDMRQMTFDGEFDAVLCWHTTFGYFEEDKNRPSAAAMLRALRPGGTLLLEVVNRDFIMAHEPGHIAFRIGTGVCIEDIRIDYITSRLRVTRILIWDDGSVGQQSHSARVFSLHEIGGLLHEVGFRVCEVSGHPSTRGGFFGQTSPEIIVLARRP
jgi:SAM-dependent methyltransferase